MWAAADDDVWAVGDGGVVRHWNGREWRDVPTGTDAAFDVVWGTGSDDVWVADAEARLAHWDGSTWSFDVADGRPNANVVAGWSAARDDVFVVFERRDGDGGPTVGHWDGTSWSLASDWDHGRLLAIHGTSSTDVWVVGFSTEIAHWNGSRWETDVLGGYEPSWLNFLAVWAAAPDDVWVAGNEGSILHYDGARWSTVSSGTTAEIIDIDGRSPDDVWFVLRGGHPEAIRWDGDGAGTPGLRRIVCVVRCPVGRGRRGVLRRAYWRKMVAKPHPGRDGRNAARGEVLARVPSGTRAETTAQGRSQRSAYGKHAGRTTSR